jgi:cytochrome c peroxidase
MVRAYKTPTLRGVASRAPYMHAGQLSTLEDVVAHYDRAPSAPGGVTELRPLSLTAEERRQLVAFMRTLDSPVIATSPALLRPPAP